MRMKTIVAGLIVALLITVSAELRAAASKSSGPTIVNVSGTCGPQVITTISAGQTFQLTDYLLDNESASLVEYSVQSLTSTQTLLKAVVSPTSSFNGSLHTPITFTGPDTAILNCAILSGSDFSGLNFTISGTIQ